MANPRTYNRNRLQSPSGSKRREQMLYVRGIPADLKHQFKAYCARRGWSMTDWLIRKMEEAVKADAKGAQAETEG